MVFSSTLSAQMTQPLTIQRLMNPEEFRASGLHKLSAVETRALNLWFNKSMAQAIEIGRNSNSPARPPNARAEKSKIPKTRQNINNLVPAARTPEDVVTLKHIINGIIVAADGRFLGTISDKKFDAKSISNKYGQYGGRFSALSIFNKFGTYGGKYSLLSPFNTHSVKPPQIYVDGKPVCFLTSNKSKYPRFDPIFLAAWLESQQ
jgi:hypothetical protein